MSGQSLPPLDLLFPFPSPSSDSFLTLSTPTDTVLASPINCHLSLDTLDALDKLDQQDKLFTPQPQSTINPNLTHAHLPSIHNDIYSFEKPRPKTIETVKLQSPEVKPDTSKTTPSPSPPKRKAKELKDKDAKDTKDSKDNKKAAKKDSMDDNHQQPPIRPRPIAAAANSSTAPAIASSSTVLIERRKRGRKRYSCAECRR